MAGHCVNWSFIKCPSSSAPMTDVFGMLPMALPHFEGAAHLCWSSNQPSSGWASVLIKGLLRGGSDAHCSFVTGFDDGRPWQTFWGSNCGGSRCNTVGGTGSWVGTGWRALCQFSRGDINLASNATAHQKKTHASSLCLALYLQIPFSSLCYQGEGLTSPTPAGRGAKKAFQSSLSPTHDGLGRWRKESGSCVGGEKGKPAMFMIYIAALKARIAGGPCQYGEGKGGERGFSFSVPAQSWKMAASTQGGIL